MVPNASGTAGFISNAADSPTVEQSVTTHPDLDPELEEIRGNTMLEPSGFSQTSGSSMATAPR